VSNLLFNVVCRLALVFFTMVAHYATFYEGGVHSILSNSLFNIVCRLALVFFLRWLHVMLLSMRVACIPFCPARFSILCVDQRLCFFLQWCEHYATFCVRVACIPFCPDRFSILCVD